MKHIWDNGSGYTNSAGDWHKIGVYAYGWYKQKGWYFHGKYHRVNGCSCIIYKDRYYELYNLLIEMNIGNMVI